MQIDGDRLNFVEDEAARQEVLSMIDNKLHELNA
jgi:deoxyadenosine/deoxycytidine kinase